MGREPKLIRGNVRDQVMILILCFQVILAPETILKIIDQHV